MIYFLPCWGIFVLTPLALILCSIWFCFSLLSVKNDSKCLPVTSSHSGSQLISHWLLAHLPPPPLPQPHLQCSLLHQFQNYDYCYGVQVTDERNLQSAFVLCVHAPFSCEIINDLRTIRECTHSPYHAHFWKRIIVWFSCISEIFMKIPFNSLQSVKWHGMYSLAHQLFFVLSLYYHCLVFFFFKELILSNILTKQKQKNQYSVSCLLVCHSAHQTEGQSAGSSVANQCVQVVS